MVRCIRFPHLLIQLFFNMHAIQRMAIQFPLSSFFLRQPTVGQDYWNPARLFVHAMG